MSSDLIDSLFKVPQPSKLANRFLGKETTPPSFAIPHPPPPASPPPPPLPTTDPSDPEVLRRTLFIGNLPNKCKASDVKKLFSAKDAVVSVRFRAIQLTADNRLSRKVAIRRHAIDADGSCNAYVLLRSPEDVIAAIDRLNGITFMDRVLRVDQATEPGTKVLTDKRTNKLSVFVGHVPFDATEEEVREIFEVCGEIHHVRLPKDAKGQSRGIAYVTFQEEEAVDLALKFDKASFRSQTLRVQRSNPIKAERIKRKQIKGTEIAKKTKFPEAKGKFEGKRAKGHDDDKNRAIKKYLKMRAHVKRKRAAP